MVRLEEFEGKMPNIPIKVSIPIWCDWKSLRQGTRKSYWLFQFLYGAIGRRTSSKPLGITSLFQFLYGAIGSILPNIPWIPEGEVSIPIWCDWKRQPRWMILNCAQVSIPIWCDWKVGYWIFRSPGNSFQFLYGAIGSPLGWAMCLGGQVSIPIWCDWK